MNAYAVTVNDWPVTGRGVVWDMPFLHDGEWIAGNVALVRDLERRPTLVRDPLPWLEPGCVIWDAEWFGAPCEARNGTLRPEHSRLLKPSDWIVPQWWHATEIFLWDIDRANFLGVQTPMRGLPLYDPDKHTGINAALEREHKEMMRDCLRLDPVGRAISTCLSDISRRVRDRIYHLGAPRLYTLRLIDDLQAYWWYSIAAEPITGYVDPDLARRYALRWDVWRAGFAVVGGTDSPVVYLPPYDDTTDPTWAERALRRIGNPIRPLRML